MHCHPSVFYQAYPITLRSSFVHPFDYILQKRTYQIRNIEKADCVFTVCFSCKYSCIADSVAEKLFYAPFAAIVFVFRKYIICQVKCRFNFGKYICSFNIRINIDICTIICAIPHNSSPWIINIIPSMKMVIPQFFVPVGIIKLICLHSSFRQRTGIENEGVFDIEKRSDFHSILFSPNSLKMLINNYYGIVLEPK